MLKFLTTAAVAVAMLVGSAACGNERMVGAWMVTVEKDPFSAKKKTIAATAMGDQAAIAIRCFPESGLSAIIHVVGEKQFDAGKRVPYRYRADEGAIAEESGEAFGEGAIDLPNARQILHDAQSASALYFRISTPTAAIVDLTFKTRGATKALAQISADCPAADDGAADDRPLKAAPTH